MNPDHQGLTDEALDVLRCIAEVEDFEILNAGDVPEQLDPFIVRREWGGVNVCAINEAGQALLEGIATQPTQILTDEQLELLRSLPVKPLQPLANNPDMKILRQAGLAIAKYYPHFENRRTPAGDALLATLDHHTTKAKEDERRRIDGLAERFAEFHAAAYKATEVHRYNPEGLVGEIRQLCGIYDATANVSKGGDVG